MAAIKTYKPTTNGRRNMTVLSFEEITTSTPEKSLLAPVKKNAGRNNTGRITVRHQGGGAKQKYRIIDFKRNKDIKVGNALPICQIPVGTLIHNIELKPGKGGQLIRSAGNSAQILGREERYVLVRLASGEVRKILSTCRATVGEVGNESWELVNVGKAGRSRHMGKRPEVRGSVMNPNDHPHGGGEGRCPIGRPTPVTPWGKPALGLKTRKHKKSSNALIVRRRNGK